MDRVLSLSAPASARTSSKIEDLQGKIVAEKKIALGQNADVWKGRWELEDGTVIQVRRLSSRELGSDAMFRQVAIKYLRCVSIKVSSRAMSSAAIERFEKVGPYDRNASASLQLELSASARRRRYMEGFGTTSKRHAGTGIPISR